MGKRIKIECKQCGEGFEVTPSVLKWKNPSFCSRECSVKYRVGENHPNYVGDKNKIKTKCSQCGTSVLRHPSKIAVSANVFCSMECRQKAMTKPVHVCLDCGVTLQSRRNIRCKACNDKWMVRENTHAYKERTVVDCDQCGMEIKRTAVNIHAHNFCDQKCMGDWKSKHLKGNKSSAWKGGTSSLIKNIRRLREVKQWRNKVLERDEYTCQHCGAIEHLESHHIIGFSELIKKYNIKTVDQALECSQLWDINNGETLCVHCHADEHPDHRHLFKLRIA